MGRNNLTLLLNVAVRCYRKIELWGKEKYFTLIKEEENIVVRNGKNIS